MTDGEKIKNKICIHCGGKLRVINKNNIVEDSIYIEDIYNCLHCGTTIKLIRENGIIFEKQKEKLEKINPDKYEKDWKSFLNIIEKIIGGYYGKR